MRRKRLRWQRTSAKTTQRSWTIPARNTVIPDKLSDCQKSPPQEFSPKAKINFKYFFGGMYAEKVLCGPNSARSPFSKKWRSHFFDTQKLFLCFPLILGPSPVLRGRGAGPAPKLPVFKAFYPITSKIINV